MTYNDLASPYILNQPVYEPGKPIEHVAREQNLHPNDIIKLASNENPLGASPLAIKAVFDNIHNLHLYPDGSSLFLRDKLASKLNLKSENIICTNGSNELIVLVCQAFIKPGDEVVMGAYAFIAFKLAVLMCGGVPIEAPMPDLKQDLSLLSSKITDKTKIVYLANPNNPTGDLIETDKLFDFINKLPDSAILLYDEAYSEYLKAPADLTSFLKDNKKVIGCRTFSKIYGLAGLRVGYGWASKEAILLLSKIRQPFNVNSLAHAAAIAALDDIDHVQKSIAVNEEGKKQLESSLAAMGIKYYRSSGNFMLIECNEPLRVYRCLQSRGIIVRPVIGYGLTHHLRISIGTSDQNSKLIEHLRTAVSS